MATKTPDLSTMFKDMMGAMPIDGRAFETMFGNQTALTEKMSSVAIEAMSKSTDLSARWAQDTLAKVSAMTRSRREPADYAKAVTDFVSAQAESAAEHMAAFAEIAKKMQTETLELMLAAGKDIGEDVAAAASKATADVTAAAKKAAAR
jgi:hypothetical protein